MRFTIKFDVKIYLRPIHRRYEYKIKWKALEKKLYEWIVDQRRQRLSISKNLIIPKAKWIPCDYGLYVFTGRTFCGIISPSNVMALL